MNSIVHNGEIYQIDDKISFNAGDYATDNVIITGFAVCDNKVTMSFHHESGVDGSILMAGINIVKHETPTKIEKHIIYEGDIIEFATTTEPNTILSAIFLKNLNDSAIECYSNHKRVTLCIANINFIQCKHQNYSQSMFNKVIKECEEIISIFAKLYVAQIKLCGKHDDVSLDKMDDIKNFIDMLHLYSSQSQFDGIYYMCKIQSLMVLVRYTHVTYCNNKLKKLESKYGDYPCFH